MKTKKSLAFSVICAVALLAALVVSCVAFTACGATTYGVKWDVDSHATITDIKVDDEAMTALPESVEEGKTLTFKVTTANGYSIDRVTGASLRSGVYTIKVVKDTEIKVTTKKDVQSITVTGFDNTKQYFVGDEIDLEGVTVTAKYVDGDVAVTDYTVSTRTFQGGEKSVTFGFGGKEQTFDIPVVEYKVTIDLAGGTLSSALTDAYAAAAEAKTINNYTNEDGVITFTYIDLETTLDLPTKDDVEKQYYGFIRFDGDTLASITSKTAQSINITAVWEYQPVKVSKVEMIAKEVEVKTEGEEGEDPVVSTVTKPYLIITGTWNGATHAKLFLKEGDKKVELSGTEIDKEEGKDDFTLEFDLTLLSARADCKGAWMDIRFNATVEGKEESMPLHITKPNTFDVDLATKLRVAGFNYLFATYTDTSDDTTLKVYYNDTFYEYSVAVDDTDKDDPLLIIEGKMLENTYNGGKITISWWITSESPVDESPIDANGNFRVEIALNDIPLGSNGYAHVTIAGASGESYGGTNTDLLHSASTTEFPTLENKVGEIGNAFRYEAASGTAYYIGYAWNGLMIYARSEAVVLDTATVTKGGEEGAEKAYLTLNGTYSASAFATAEDAKAAIEAAWAIDVQALGVYSDIANTFTVTTSEEDRSVRILIDITGASAGDVLFSHAYLGMDEGGTKGNLEKGTVAPDTGASVTVGNLTYTVGNAATDLAGTEFSWGSNLVIVNVTEA